MNPATCPDRNVLSAFFDGKLSADEVESWSPHVESCPHCLAVLEELSGPTHSERRPATARVGTTTVLPESITLLWSELSATCLVEPGRIAELKAQVSDALQGIASPAAVAEWLVAQKVLTPFQSSSLLEGRGRKLVLGEYILLDLIGVGGMGQVYKARHRRMDRVVALKVLAGEIVANSEAVKRFQREVRAAAKLEHPHVVTAYDAGEANGVHFLVMQYVAGRDLATISRQRGPLPVGESVSYMLQAARGLAYAYSEGLIHRDIKPGNMLVDGKGTLKILDLGLARLDHTEWQRSELTGSGQVMGTVDYMSPEQAADTRSADARSDIYSLGCTLYRVLVGEVPYPRDSLVNTVLAHREAPVPRLRARRYDVPPELDELCAAMMAKSPADRPQTMQQVAERLERLSTASWRTEATELLPHDRFGEPSASATARRDDPARITASKTATSLRLPRRRWTYAAVGGVALVLIAGGLMIWAMNRQPGDDQQPLQAKHSTSGSTTDAAPNASAEDRVAEYAAMLRDGLWKPGQEITVAFLDGDAATQRRIKELVRQWTQACNLSFRFIESADAADIRIAISPGARSYSYVGVNCRKVPPPEPTMAILPPQGRSPEAFGADVLKHFGHALGLRHEHLNPNARLPIDREATYALHEQYGMTREQVDLEYFRQENHHVYGFNKPFDPDSVMLGAMRREILTQDYPFKLNWQLSAGDRELVAQLYPFINERAVAEALISAKAQGFWVDTVDGNRRRVTSREELPSAEFSIIALTCMYQDFPVAVLPSLLARGRLSSLYVAGCPNVEDDLLRSLAGRLQLSGLSTVNTRVTGDGLVESGQLPYLLELYLSREQLSAAVASELGRVQRISELTIYNGCDQDCLEQVARLRSLKFLLLDEGLLDLPQGFAAIGMLPALEKVGLQRLRGLTPQNIRTLVEHPALRELSIYHTELTEEHVAVLQQGASLTRLSLNDCGLKPQAAQALQESLPQATLKWDGVIVYSPPGTSEQPPN